MASESAVWSDAPYEQVTGNCHHETLHQSQQNKFADNNSWMPDDPWDWQIKFRIKQGSTVGSYERKQLRIREVCHFHTGFTEAKKLYPAWIWHQSETCTGRETSYAYKDITILRTVEFYWQLPSWQQVSSLQILVSWQASLRYGEIARHFQGKKMQRH